MTFLFLSNNKLKRTGLMGLMILAYMLSFVQLFKSFNTKNKTTIDDNSNRMMMIHQQQPRIHHPHHHMNNNHHHHRPPQKHHHFNQQQLLQQRRKNLQRQQQQQQQSQPMMMKNTLVTEYKGTVQNHTCKLSISTDNNNQTITKTKSASSMNMQMIVEEGDENLISYPQYPTFIIVGAQKSGTTSLLSYFNKHPLISKPSYNEPHFFDKTIHKLIKQHNQKQKQHGSIIKSNKNKQMMMKRYSTSSRNINNDTDNKIDDDDETLWCYLGREYYKILSTERKMTVNGGNNDLQQIQRQQRRQPQMSQQQQQQQHQHQNQQMILLPFSFEKTPSYLHRFSAPKMIQKICPWIPKIVIILRNPVDRAYSHYQFGNEQMSRSIASTITSTSFTTNNAMDVDVDADVDPYAVFSNRTFEDYIQSEINLMKSWNMTTATILPAILQQENEMREAIPYLLDHPIDEKHWTVHPEVAFNKNHKIRGGEGEVDQFHALMIRKGIYAPQLRQWYQDYPKNSILVLNYNELHQNTTDVYFRILDFVGIPHDRPILHDFTKRLHQQHYEPMSNTTRSYLEAFYKPYNDQLADLLGDEWKDIWTGE